MNPRKGEHNILAYTHKYTDIDSVIRTIKLIQNTKPFVPLWCLEFIYGLHLKISVTVGLKELSPYQVLFDISEIAECKD